MNEVFAHSYFTGTGVFVLESQLPDDFGNVYIPFENESYRYPDGLLEKRKHFYARDRVYEI